MRGSNTCELVFEDVLVPAENVLRSEGDGVRILMSGPGLRTHCAVRRAGGHHAQACVDEVLPYLHARKQFGQSIGEFQLIQGKLADMYADLNACPRLPVRRRRRLRPRRGNAPGRAAVILYAAEKATQMALQAIQAWAASATSTNPTPAACCATPSCMRSAPAPAKSAAC